jgi:hypothetical protein
MVKIWGILKEMGGFGLWDWMWWACGYRDYGKAKGSAGSVANVYDDVMLYIALFWRRNIEGFTRSRFFMWSDLGGVGREYLAAHKPSAGMILEKYTFVSVLFV